MAETAHASAPTPLATTEVTATNAVTLVMAASSVYGISPPARSGYRTVLWSVFNRGTGGASLRWDGLADAVYNNAACFLLPTGAAVNIEGGRITAAADTTGCTLAIMFQPAPYR